MNYILELILNFLISPGIPKKREYKAAKILMIIFFIIIALNAVYLLNKDDRKDKPKPGYTYIL